MITNIMATKAMKMILFISIGFRYTIFRCRINGYSCDLIGFKGFLMCPNRENIDHENEKNLYRCKTILSICF